MQTNDSAIVEVASKPADSHAATPSMMDVSPELMILTWATFIIMTFVLYKVAWKPILGALDTREKKIRQSLDDAEKARLELASAEQKRREIVVEAEKRARALQDEARVAAQQSAAAIHAQAKADADAMLKESLREIQMATDSARLELRREVAGLAIDAAGKIMGENMDSGKNRAIVERMTGKS